MWSAYRRSLHLPAMIALKIFRKLLFFCMFSLFNFSSFFQGGGAADPICPYVRTPMVGCFNEAPCVCVCAAKLRRRVTCYWRGRERRSLASGWRKSRGNWTAYTRQWRRTRPCYSRSEQKRQRYVSVQLHLTLFNKIKFARIMQHEIDDVPNIECTKISRCHILLFRHYNQLV